VIGVAATDLYDGLASWSNYGAVSIDLSAPGVGINSTTLTSYGYWSGTSMASPHVAGAAALLLSACTLTTSQLKSALLTTVDPVPALSGKTVTGGRLNVDKALAGCVVAGSPEVSIWPGESKPNPAVPWHSDSAVTLGVKFRSDIAGEVTGIRFWKASSFDSGTHTGLLFDRSGKLLSQATFDSETATGWQKVTFPQPVLIEADKTYVAAYHTPSGWSGTPGFFATQGVDSPPLHALKSGVDGTNGLYVYGTRPAYPSTPYGSNYWVDVVFRAGASSESKAATLWTGTPQINQPWRFNGAVTLGTRFRSDVPGKVTGARFWKSSPNDNGVHTGLLYDGSSGALLAQGTFTGETASGWQQMLFATPVPIVATKNYVIAYHTPTGWSATSQYFASTGWDAPPLHAPKNAPYSGNGIYIYGSNPAFPVQTTSANYWVDVVFEYE
jgi:hypothetical protein